MEFPDDLVTLPRNHPTLFSIPNDDLVLRRFNPDNEQIRDVISYDEGDVPRYRLKSGALTGFSDGGCSVGRDQILEEAGIERAEMLHPKHRKLAEARVEDIRDFLHADNNGDETHPFEVLPDAYPASDSPARWEVAHAVLALADNFTGAARTSAVGALARVLFNPLATP